MGEVYRARDTRLDRTVAIKVLPAAFAADPDRRARVEREARAVAALSHPHICTIHDVGRHEEIDYLVMEYLEGETLADRLVHAKGPLPLDQVLRFGIDIADALDKAHRAGIAHRDVKPANIFLVGRRGASALPDAKLLDFGLAKLREPAAPITMSAMTATPSWIGSRTPLAWPGRRDAGLSLLPRPGRPASAGSRSGRKTNCADPVPAFPSHMRPDRSAPGRRGNHHTCSVRRGIAE